MVRGRCHLSLQERRGDAGTLECDCGPLRGLQAGATSAVVYCKDVNRRGDFLDIHFDFLGFQLRARKVMCVIALIWFVLAVLAVQVEEQA